MPVEKEHWGCHEILETIIDLRKPVPVVSAQQAKIEISPVTGSYLYPCSGYQLYTKATGVIKCASPYGN